MILLRDPTLPARIEHRHGLSHDALADMTRWPSTLLTIIGVLHHNTWLRYAHQTLPEQAVSDYLADHGTPNPPVVDLLRHATRAGLRLLTMANSTTRLYNDLAHHHLTDLATQLYLSTHSGYATPDPRAFEHILRRESLTPSRTIYIDAARTCVDAARQLGIRAHTYTDPTRLRRFLTEQTSEPDPAQGSQLR